MADPIPDRVNRLLIWRIGSLGDTAVALPVFHMLAARFVGAERRVLTNFPDSDRAAPLQSVLGDAGFADGYFAYPHATRDVRRLAALRRDIAAWRPDLAVYLNAPRPRRALWRDRLFLRACGVRSVVAMPDTDALALHRGPDAEGVYEKEASRLVRCVAPVGAAAIDDPAAWSLRLSAAERAAADALLDGWAGRGRFVALSIGAKIAIKDWGDDNWRSVLAGLAADEPSLGLVLTGGEADRLRSEALAGGWRGPALNLCGVPPRESAAVIERARLYAGHDSGPMHLAASVGTPIAAVFCDHLKPGLWFPFGAAHRVFYPGLAFSGGAPSVRREAAGETGIADIPPYQVLDACRGLLRAGRTGAP